MFLFLTLHYMGGGRIPPPPQFLDSRTFNIDLRGPRFWYNSYFIVTILVQNVQDLKGVPEKICSVISEAGVKIKKFKLQKKILKDILNNLQSNYKAQATATFLISALISEIWAFKAKKCLYFWNKGPNKKSVLRKKVLEFVFRHF